jgi:hypothetical protein
LGERQTEDLEAQCSIHCRGILLLLLWRKLPPQQHHIRR